MIFEVQVARQLKPARTERKKLPVHVMRDQAVMLLDNIQRAHNLPVRIGGAAAAPAAAAVDASAENEVSTSSSASASANAHH